MTAYIDAHLRHLRAAGRSVRTIKARQMILYRVDQTLPYGLTQAATEELEAWLATPEWKGWTLHTYYMHLFRFFDWATRGRDPMISWNPMLAIPRPRAPKSLPIPVTDDEVARALRGSDNQWRIVIALAAYAGLRASEIASMVRERITPRLLTVIGGKGGKDALLPTHPLIWKLVEQHPGGPLVRRADGQPVDGHWLSQTARRHFDRLGMPGVRLQRFRHWFGTAAHGVENDLLVTQRLMRHEDPRTTGGYAQVTERMVETVNRLPLFEL